MEKTIIQSSPKISTAIAKKHAGKIALYLGEKIVHIGGFSSKKAYKATLKKLMKKYPHADEADFGSTFIFGKRVYILSCILSFPITKEDQV